MFHANVKMSGCNFHSKVNVILARVHADCEHCCKCFKLLLETMTSGSFFHISPPLRFVAFFEIFSALDFLFNFQPRICFANTWHYRHWELPSFPGIKEAGIMVTGSSFPGMQYLRLMPSRPSLSTGLHIASTFRGLKAHAVDLQSAESALRGIGKVPF